MPRLIIHKIGCFAFQDIVIATMLPNPHNPTPAERPWLPAPFSCPFIERPLFFCGSADLNYSQCVRCACVILPHSPALYLYLASLCCSLALARWPPSLSVCYSFLFIQEECS